MDGLWLAARGTWLPSQLLGGRDDDVVAPLQLRVNAPLELDMHDEGVIRVQLAWPEREDDGAVGVAKRLRPVWPILNVMLIAIVTGVLGSVPVLLITSGYLGPVRDCACGTCHRRCCTSSQAEFERDFSSLV